MTKDLKYIIKRVIIGVLISIILMLIGSFKVNALSTNAYYNSYDTNFFVCDSNTCGINTTSNYPFKNMSGKLTFTIYQAPETSGVELINEVIVSDYTGYGTTCNIGNLLFYNDNNTQRGVITAVCDVTFGSNGWRNITIKRRGNGKLYLLFSQYATLSNEGDLSAISGQLQSIYNRLDNIGSDLYNMQDIHFITIRSQLENIYNKMLENNLSITQSIDNNTNAINEVNDKANESEVVDSTSGTQTDKAPSVRAVKDLTTGHVLYSNASGTTGNITLSDSAANYVRFEIEYTNPDALYDVIDIYEPDGKDVNLSIPFAFTGGSRGLFAIHSRDITINGTSISTKVDAVNGNFYGALVLWENTQITLDKTNYIKIVKVIGYKD